MQKKYLNKIQESAIRKEREKGWGKSKKKTTAIERAALRLLTRFLLRNNAETYSRWVVISKKLFSVTVCREEWPQESRAKRKAALKAWKESNNISEGQILANIDVVFKSPEEPIVPER